MAEHEVHRSHEYVVEIGKRTGVLDRHRRRECVNMPRLGQRPSNPVVTLIIEEKEVPMQDLDIEND